MKHFFNINNKMDYGIQTKKLIKMINNDKDYLECFNEGLLMNIYAYESKSIEEYIEKVLKIKDILKMNKEKFSVLIELIYNNCLYIDNNFTQEPLLTVAFNETKPRKIRRLNGNIIKNLNFFALKIGCTFKRDRNTKLYFLSKENYIIGKNNDFETELSNLLSDYENAKLIEDINDRILEKRKCLSQINIILETYKSNLDKYTKLSSIRSNVFNLLNNTKIRHCPETEELGKYLETLNSNEFEIIYDYLFNEICMLLLANQNIKNLPFMESVFDNIKKYGKKNKK